MTASTHADREDYETYDGRANRVDEMRKTELRVGEHYALGSRSRFERFSSVHAEVLELVGRRPSNPRAPSSHMREGIVVRVHLPDVGERGFNGSSATGIHWGARDGDEVALDSARYFLEPWETYAERLAEYEERVARQRSIAADNRAAAKAIESLVSQLSSDYSVKVAYRLTSDGQFIIFGRELEKLIDGARKMERAR